jgi:hypothetical protein
MPNWLKSRQRRRKLIFWNVWRSREKFKLKINNI